MATVAADITVSTPVESAAPVTNGHDTTGSTLAVTAKVETDDNGSPLEAVNGHDTIDRVTTPTSPLNDVTTDSGLASFEAMNAALDRVEPPFPLHPAETGHVEYPVYVYPISSAHFAPAPALNGVSVAPVSSGPKRTGRCKFFNAVKGFGFILDNQPEDLGGDEVFVHYSAIEAVQSNRGTFKSLLEGEELEYTIIQGPKGWQAQGVTGPGGMPCFGSPTLPPKSLPSPHSLTGSRQYPSSSMNANGIRRMSVKSSPGSQDQQDMTRRRSSTAGSSPYYPYNPAFASGPPGSQGEFGRRTSLAGYDSGYYSASASPMGTVQQFFPPQSFPFAYTSPPLPPSQQLSPYASPLGLSQHHPLMMPPPPPMPPHSMSMSMSPMSPGGGPVFYDSLTSPVYGGAPGVGPPLHMAVPLDESGSPYYPISPHGPGPIHYPYSPQQHGPPPPLHPNGHNDGNALGYYPISSSNGYASHSAPNGHDTSLTLTESSEELEVVLDTAANADETDRDTNATPSGDKAETVTIEKGWAE